MIPRYQSTNSEDRELSRLDGRVKTTFDAITGKPGLDHLIVTGVRLFASVAPNQVPHGLGRRLVGWSVVRQRGSAIVWDEQDVCRAPSLMLDLRTSADVEVDIMVF